MWSVVIYIIVGINCVKHTHKYVYILNLNCTSLVILNAHIGYMYNIVVYCVIIVYFKEN